jgi:Flp pilus assembly protein TadG
MTADLTRRTRSNLAGLFARLARDTAGNTLMIVAASLLPLMGIIGGGIDIGRAYLSETRLQDACDAGVLAARKRLGTEGVTDGTIPNDAELAGERFFNLNFQQGAYGSKSRTFAMTLDEDLAINGSASVAVPTTLMKIFGFGDIPVNVTCQAQLNMANTDVMMVLDVTGSMADTNPGDSTSKIEALKATVRNFYSQLSAAAPSSTRLRFGFVPYSTNVNVGSLLQDSWVNTSWNYQSREQVKETGPLTTTSYARNWIYKSGTIGAASVLSTYAATYHAAVAGYTYTNAYEQVVTVPPKAAYYTCDTATPAGDYSQVDKKLSTTTEPFAGPPTGTRKIETYERTQNGTYTWTALSGSTCTVYSQVYNAYVRTYEWVTDPYQTTVNKWRYDQLPKDVSNWRSETTGCMEERSTYEIDDYNHIDLSRALDLDIDLVPTADAKTKWSPMYPSIIYERAMKYDGSGSFSPGQKVTADEYMNPATLGTAACPPAARKLAPITASQLDAYLATLKPNGSTYHDIGMIWGGAADLADRPVRLGERRRQLDAAEHAPPDLPHRRRDRAARHRLLIVRRRAARPATLEPQVQADPDADRREALHRGLQRGEEEEHHRVGDLVRHLGQPGHAGLRRRRPLFRRRRHRRARRSLRYDRQAHGRAQGDQVSAPAAVRPLAGLAHDTRGVTAVEFAIIAPALLIILLGTFDIGYNLYAASVLEGATQKAARDSTIEGAETKGVAIDDAVTAAVHRVVPSAAVTFSRSAYRDYSDIHKPEDYTDVDKDGACDNGEPFEDVNANGVWDTDRGSDTMGGARDAVLYTVTVSYRRIFPLMHLLGLPEVVTAQSETVLRNQPYGTQNQTVTIGKCG